MHNSDELNCESNNNNNNNNIINNHNKNVNDNVIDWTVDDVLDWAKRESLPETVLDCIQKQFIDGKCLLTLNETDVRDFRDHYLYISSLSDIKHFLISIRNVQQLNYSSQLQLLGIISFPNHNNNNNNNNSVSELCYGCCANCNSNNNNNNNNSILSTNHNHHHQNHNTNHHPTTIHHLNNNVHNQNSLNYHNIHHQHNQHPAISSSCLSNNTITTAHHHHINHHHDYLQNHDLERISPPLSVDGRATSIQPELFKTMISLGYAFLVTWITAFVMVVVHERVPDMKRYPPLPDIFLDNVPHIPWAFHMCEITGTLLFCLWICVLTVHKHRMVLLRRFFALSGTVFLLRCVTMLITSLSVPGTHLQCNPNDYKVDDTNLTTGEAILLRISRAYTIWSGLGMSIQGVRTCGDYMFSGHTVALTILNFFITEYTPRNLYFLHTITWLLNMFGIFFILAAHEHYSIDVFVAFYITSRLFLYYHTLANNQALMSHDSNRTRIWFPMFSYFESSVDGIIPNEYDTIEIVLTNIFSWIISIKDCCMLTARRFWIAHQHQLQPLPIKKPLLRQSPDQQPPQLQKELNKHTQFTRSNQNNENNQQNCDKDDEQKIDEHNLKLQEFNLLSKSLNNLLEYNSYYNNKKILIKPQQQQQNNSNFNNLNKIKVNKEKIHDDILIKNNIDELNNNNNNNISKTSNDNGLKKDN